MWCYCMLMFARSSYALTLSRMTPPGALWVEDAAKGSLSSWISLLLCMLFPTAFLKYWSKSDGGRGGGGWRWRAWGEKNRHVKTSCTRNPNLLVLLDIRGWRISIFFIFLLFSTPHTPKGDNCAWWWSLLTLFFWSYSAAAAPFSTWLGFTADLSSHSSLWLIFFLFLRKEIAISQRYGNAAQIHNYQAWKSVGKSRLPVLVYSSVGLALLLECFLEQSWLPFSDICMISVVYLNIEAFDYLFFMFDFEFSVSGGIWMTQKSFKGNSLIGFKVLETSWGRFSSEKSSRR